MNTRNLLGICAVCLLLTSGAVALAQGGRPTGPKSGGMGRGGPPALPDSTEIVKIVDEMAQELSLSADQKEQIADLHVAHFDEVRVQMSNVRGDREDHRRKMDALRLEFENEVKAMLSDEQQDKFDDLMKSRRPRSGSREQRKR